MDQGALQSAGAAVMLDWQHVQSWTLMQRRCAAVLVGNSTRQLHVSYLQSSCCHRAQELLESGYLTEVHKFSKFIHGSATLMPDMVQVWTGHPALLSTPHPAAFAPNSMAWSQGCCRLPSCLTWSWSFVRAGCALLGGR